MSRTWGPGPGCPAFVSETPWGEQRVRLLDVLEVRGGDALATTVRINAPGASDPFYAAAGVYRAGDRLGLVSMFGASPMERRFAEGVVEAAVAKL